MKTIAIIPARGGSKGIPRKNIRSLCGKPLLAWSIEAAQHAAMVNRVVVSSEDPEIRDVALRYGAEVVDQPGASDTSKTDDALIYTVRHLEMCEGYMPDLVVLLQATVPVRAPGLVDVCITHLIQTDAASLMTVNRAHFVWWRWKANGKWSTNSPTRLPRQQMPPCDLRWLEDGSVYLVRTPELLRTGGRVVEPMQIVETDRTVDIDTEEDFAVAAALMEHRAWIARQGAA